MFRYSRCYTVRIQAIVHDWADFYPQCKIKDVFNEEIPPNIHSVTCIGGKGMTASAGFARENIASITNRVIT